MNTKVLIVTNDGNFFLSHRFSLAKGLQLQGYEVSVACPDSEATDQIVAAGFSFYSIPLDRKGLNPFAQIRLICHLNKLYRKLKPQLIHHFSIKPIIFGSIAAKLAKQTIVVNAPTGLGYVFTNSTMKAKLLKTLVLRLYRIALRRSRSCLIFQNVDDEQLFGELGLLNTSDKYLVKGSGVDPEQYINKDEIDGDPIVILPARLLWDKGVQEFVDAARSIKAKGTRVRFALVGDVDPGNPATVERKQLRTWVEEGVVEWWGWQKNMIEIFHRTHIVCLPSYREGVPKVLLEAASCGKPIVTTHAPGCREVVVDNVNGFLVPVKNSTMLADRLLTLINDANLRVKMGLAGREKVQAEFSTEKVVKDTMTIYNTLLDKYRKDGCL